jgi:CRP-like cAMP-binding protein
MPANSENLLLAGLSAPARQLLTPHLLPTALPVRTILYKAEEDAEFAYFITSGIASVVTTMADGRTVEVGLIGREGLSGAMHLLGSSPVSTHCFMQLAGNGLQLRMAELRRIFRTSEEVRDRILEFIQEQALGTSQLAACQRLHGAEERLARWLLMANDRTHSEELDFTQEFLAMMLGSQRTTVTAVASELQRQGFIEYRRGRVRILDRRSLEGKACDCYSVTQHLYTSLYQRPLAAS